MFCARLSKLSGTNELRSENREGFEKHAEKYTMPRPSAKVTPTPGSAPAPVQVPVPALVAASAPHPDRSTPGSVPCTTARPCLGVSTGVCVAELLSGCGAGGTESARTRTCTGAGALPGLGVALA